MKLPNIDFMMEMTKEFINGRLDSVSYSLDFEYHMEKLYEQMHKENGYYCDLIYKDLYENGVARFKELSGNDFKKLIKRQYNYIKKIAIESC